MSLLLDIQRQLEVADQRVVSLEQALREHPGYPSIAANLDSAVRIQKKLQAQFMEAAENVGVETCRYRAFDDHERPSTGAAFGAVARFQHLVSVVYAALK